MQFFGQGKPPAGVIFDSDMGNTIDDVLALALLYGLDGKNEARVVSVSVTKSNLKSAAFCEVMGRFYAGSVSGDFGSFRRSLPVGMAIDGKMPQDTAILTAPLAKPVYVHGIHKETDTADAAALIRNAFTAQHDQNALVVLTGPATNLVAALRLPGVKDLAVRKVRLLAIAADWKSDLAAARELLANWPTPVVVAAPEIGDALPFPAASIEKDFAWSKDHPVVDAYRAAYPAPQDAPTHAMAAALYAVRPQEGYFKLSDPGTISVVDGGRTQLTPSAEGKHRQLLFDPAQKERVIATYVELVSAKPVPRMPRFRQQQQQQQQQQKPPEQPKPAAKP
jgi:hypothetical protein